MAWNEPGGGNKDPWGNNGGDQGPPDLDEALKKLQEKLNSIFSGGGKGGGPAGAEIGGSLIALILLVLVVIWAGLGTYQLDEKDRAVVLRFGKYLDTYGPGLHWNPPLIDTKTIVNVTEERQYPTEGQMLTVDENIVDVRLTVQYNISNPKDFVLNVRNPEISLRHATDSALRHVVGDSKLDEVVSTGREEMADKVKTRLQSYLDNYGTGIRVIKINVQDAKPPDEVKAAYDDVIKAREDQERSINEAQAYANGIIPEARGQAQRLIEEAKGYKAKVTEEAKGEAQRFDELLTEYKKAPEVTRERLYLDTLQEVMSKSTKILVDVDGSNNMMYLPLDKIMEHQSKTGSSSAKPLSTTDINDIASDVYKKLRDDQSSRRGDSR